MGGLSDPSWPDRRLDYHVEAVISNMGKQEVGWLMVGITGRASGLTVRPGSKRVELRSKLTDINLI